MSIGELWQVKKAALQLQWQVASTYYPKSLRFALCDLALGVSSLFYNAYNLCRKRGGTYGETPIPSLRRIAEFCELNAEDCWLELGSGRGKGAFWMAHFTPCQTIGVEKISLFHWIASAIRSLFQVPNLSFIRQDQIAADFSKATYVYLYSTCMSESELLALTEKMDNLRIGAKVITISAPLPPNKAFQTIGSFPLSFPWGETEAFLNERQ